MTNFELCDSKNWLSCEGRYERPLILQVGLDEEDKENESLCLDVLNINYDRHISYIHAKIVSYNEIKNIPRNKWICDLGYFKNKGIKYYETWETSKTYLCTHAYYLILCKFETIYFLFKVKCRLGAHAVRVLTDRVMEVLVETG